MTTTVRWGPYRKCLPRGHQRDNLSMSVYLEVHGITASDKMQTGKHAAAYRWPCGILSRCREKGIVGG